MSTTTTDADAATAAPPRPKHGYTKDGTPVCGNTHRFAKHDTAA